MDGGRCGLGVFSQIEVAEGLVGIFVRFCEVKVSRVIHWTALTASSSALAVRTGKCNVMACPWELSQGIDAQGLGVQLPVLSKP